MKNTTKKSIVNYETDWSIKDVVSKTVEPNVLATIVDILKATTSYFSFNDKIDFSLLKTDVPVNMSISDIEGYDGYFFSTFKWLPDSKSVAEPTNVFNINEEFDIKNTKNHSGNIKLINIGPVDDPNTGAYEHYDTTSRSFFNDKVFSKGRFVSSCPGVKVLTRKYEGTNLGSVYDATILVRTEESLTDLWIAQIFIKDDSYMSEDSYCKIIPLTDLVETIPEGIKN